MNTYPVYRFTVACTHDANPSLYFHVETDKGEDHARRSVEAAVTKRWGYLNPVVIRRIPEWNPHIRPLIHMQYLIEEPAGAQKDDAGARGWSRPRVSAWSDTIAAVVTLAAATAAILVWWAIL